MDQTNPTGSQTISSGDVQSAYVYRDPYQIRRIEEYGKLNAKILNKLVKPEPRPR